jgi:hypothetical protein
MDDKMFEMMEKMYSEVIVIRQDLTSVKEDVKGLNIKVDKNTIMIENLISKVENIEKVQQLHMDQHEKDVKEMKNGLYNVEIITSSNWNELAKLKAIK